MDRPFVLEFTPGVLLRWTTQNIPTSAVSGVPFWSKWTHIVFGEKTLILSPFQLSPCWPQVIDAWCFVRNVPYREVVSNSSCRYYSVRWPATFDVAFIFISIRDSSILPEELASQSVRLKEEQLRREEEKVCVDSLFLTCSRPWSIFLAPGDWTQGATRDQREKAGASRQRRIS